MTHPEIPKDHPRFEVGTLYKGTPYCFRRSHKTGAGLPLEWQPIHKLQGLDRQDAAAHAAAWWFEKAIALFLNGGFEDDQEAQKRVAIGRAWLAWGAQK